MIEVSSEQSRSQFYIRTVLLALLLLLLLCVVLLPFFFSLFVNVDTVCGSQQSTLTWSIVIMLLYAAARRTSMCSYVPACCRAVCCYIAVDAAAAACSLNPNTIFFDVPLGSTVAFSASILKPTIHIILFSVVRACAEPRRASARRGGTPLVCVYIGLAGTPSSIKGLLPSVFGVLKYYSW